MTPIRTRQYKIPNWQAKVKKELNLLIVAGEKLHVPGILAIVFFSIGIALFSPFFPGVLGMVMYELIKDMCSNLIWKMFESPAKLSEYFRSGMMKADINEELKSSQYRIKTAHFFEKTEILTITLNELISHQDLILLQDFLQEIKSYPGILTTRSRESLLRTVKNSSWALNLQVTKKEYINELREVAVTKSLPPSEKAPITFPWGKWVFSWVLSVLVGALIIILLFLYFHGVRPNLNPNSIFSFSSSTPLIIPSVTFSPIPPTAIVSLIPPKKITTTPPAPTITQTPTSQVCYYLRSNRNVDYDGESLRLGKGTSVNIDGGYSQADTVRVTWSGFKNGTKIQIPFQIKWDELEMKSCP